VPECEQRIDRVVRPDRGRLGKAAGGNGATDKVYSVLLPERKDDYSTLGRKREVLPGTDGRQRERTLEKVQKGDCLIIDFLPPGGLGEYAGAFWILTDRKNESKMVEK
jgi:hypothetical protein